MNEIEYLLRPVTQGKETRETKVIKMKLIIEELGSKRTAMSRSLLFYRYHQWSKPAALLDFLLSATRRRRR